MGKYNIGRKKELKYRKRGNTLKGGKEKGKARNVEREMASREGRKRECKKV